MALPSFPTDQTLSTRSNGLANFAVMVCIALGSFVMTSAQPAMANDHVNARTITVSASANIEAEPDAASISTGVTTQAPTARDALSSNSDTVQGLIDGLIEMGVKRKDIQTSSLNVHPQYNRRKDGQPPTISGYSVTNTVTVQTRDLEKLGRILDQLVTLGANQIHGLSFHVTQAESLKDGARTKAIENARRRAELFAGAANARLGKVLHISEETSHNAPRPVMATRRTMAAESVPIEAGSQSLSARVTVTWALQD